ncbi:MAG: TolC family protein, partial [Tangfeifania sp.]
MLTGLVSFAQQKWSLEECIGYAFKNNLDIESRRIASEANREMLTQSKRNRLPYIDAGTNYNINFGKSVDPNTNDVTYNSFASNGYSLSGSVPLFEGFIRKNQIGYNRFVYLAGLAKEETQKIEIAFAVMNAFHNSLYYKGLLEIVKEQKELSELNLEKVTKETEVGISAKTDILEIEARLAEEELLVIRTTNNLNASLLDLKRAMNFPPARELHLQDLNDIRYASSAVFENADSVYSMAVKHLPDVEVKQQELKAVERNLAIARGQLSPSLTLSGGYYTGYYETRTDEAGNPISFRDQFSNNASQSVGVRLSIPVFTRWRNRSQIKLSKLDLEAKKVELQNYKNQLYYEIESYCQELSATSAEYLQAKKQTESNELAFEVTQKKKEQGLINILDFYMSKNLLSNAQGELLRTKLQYIIK